MKILKNKNFFIKITRRKFFGFFEKKKEAQVTVRDFNEEEFKKLSEFKENQRHLSKAELHYIELRKEREEREAQKLEEQRILEEANIAYEREEETTIKFMDYRAIMLNNQRILPEAEFKNLDHFLDFIVKFNYDDQQLNEDNFKKVFKAFNHYSKDIDESIIEGPFYQKFLNHIKSYVYTFYDGETLVQLSMFLDIYCVTYPELYVKFQRQIIKQLDDLSIDDVISIIVGLSNQGEGEDDFWDKIETKLMSNLEVLTTESLINIIQAFFNVQTGTKIFIDKILTKLIEKLEDKYLKPSLNQILIVTNTLSFLQESIIKDQRDKIWQLCEQRILQSKDFLNFELSCKLARAFGNDRGSGELFDILLVKVKEVTNNFSEVSQQQFQLILEGFLFTYRIQEQDLDQIIQKFDVLKNELQPQHLASFAKTLYMYSKENHPITQDIEQLILAIIQNQPESLDKQNIYFILQSYLSTRMGSRQFYRLLEFNLPSSLKQHQKDKEFLQTVKEMYEQSALCSLEFLLTLQRMIDLNQQMKDCKKCIKLKNEITQYDYCLNKEVQYHQQIEKDQQQFIKTLQECIQQYERELAILRIQMQKEQMQYKKKIDGINLSNKKLQQRILALQQNSLDRQHSFNRISMQSQKFNRQKKLSLESFKIITQKKRTKFKNFLKRRSYKDSQTQATNNKTISDNIFMNSSQLSFLSNASENQLNQVQLNL